MSIGHMTDAARKEELSRFYADVRLRASTAKTGDIRTSMKTSQRAAVPAKGYQKPQKISRDSGRRKDRGLNFEASPYDLRELAKARDAESLINTSVERHVEVALQENWRFEGSDQEMIDYIEKRLFEIEFMSAGVSQYKILNQILDQLINFGTAFLMVRRDRDRSSGNRIKMFGKRLDPIAAWAIADAPTMKVAVNTRGHVIGWKQEINEHGLITGGISKDKIYGPDEVFKFERHQQPGRAWGRSLYLPVLDDALMLRGLEDIVHIITQKYAYPMFQYIVGTKERPAKDVVQNDGSVISEVELAKAEIENMPPEGGWVTSERHEVKLIGTEGKVLDVSKYLQHFRQRVQDATRMSNAVLGTGDSDQSKSTSASQMKSLHDSAKYLQDVVSDGMRMFIFMLLQEGGFNVTEENMVTLSFAPPDTEEQRANDNHFMEQFNNDLLTCEETRVAMGRKCFTEKERKDTKGEMQHEREKDLAKMAAAQKAASQTSTTAKKAAGTTSQKNRPANQSGKKKTKTRVKANDWHKDAMDLWRQAKIAARDHVPVEDESSFGYNRAVSPFVDRMIDSFRHHMGEALHEGTLQAREDSGDPTANISLKQRKQIFHSVRGALKRTMRDAIDVGFPDGNKVAINAAFSSCEARFSDCAMREAVFVEKSAYMAALQNAGVVKVSVKDSDGNSSATMSTSDFCSRLLHLMDDDVTIEIKPEA